jgi:hypothetical protein
MTRDAAFALDPDLTHVDGRWRISRYEGPSASERAQSMLIFF